MSFLKFLEDNIVYLDGAMGTLLQKYGLMPGELPERFNLSHPELIVKIHRDYFDAGSNVVCTNTFGANCLKFSDSELEEIISCAIANAKRARDESSSEKPKFIALDIGPTGKLLSPLGELDFEDAVSVFKKTASLGEKYGADLIFIETMADSYEAKAALLAAKESTTLPVLVSCAYGADAKLMTGATPDAMTFLLEGLSADAIGANCSQGPKSLGGVIKVLLENSSLPVILKPNAGLPTIVAGQTKYNLTPEGFAKMMKPYVEAGVRVIGGCCGTTPEYIRELCKITEGISPKPIVDKGITAISSYTHSVKFGGAPILIGERINPTGKKRFRKALIDGDMDYILSEAISEEEAGAHVLDVNVGIPEIDEVATLKETVFNLQTATNLPLQIDTSNSEAMEAALRCYNGKALINSVNGTAESMAKIFPLCKKYGGVIIALTLDEGGIPKTAEERFKIAEKILSTAKLYGIDKKDIIFDTLAMSVSADKDAARVTLDALSKIKNELFCNTSLGVSNISFGLPKRDYINCAFFTMALNLGLSAAIMNPKSVDMMKTYYSFCALSGLDENFEKYIEFSESITDSMSVAFSKKEEALAADASLKYSIIKGLREVAADACESLLKESSATDIIDGHIIPALSEVGKRFEEKTLFLPQLLMSAEAAKAAFEKIKSSFDSGSAYDENKTKLVLATVKGDIHDIGKNIVKLLLENFGISVIDLGKDVACEDIVEATLRTKAQFVGLSALMTTTAPAMEKTVKLLREKAPFAKIIVGGAVITEEYAEKIGADKYAKDAMEAVRYVQSIT